MPLYKPSRSMPCSSETTSQNLAPIWLPHCQMTGVSDDRREVCILHTWPVWRWTISRILWCNVSMLKQPSTKVAFFTASAARLRRPNATTVRQTRFHVHESPVNGVMGVLVEDEMDGGVENDFNPSTTPILFPRLDSISDPNNVRVLAPISTFPSSLVAWSVHFLVTSQLEY